MIEIDAVYVTDGDKLGKFDSENYIKKASLKFALSLLDKEECKELYPSERVIPSGSKREAAELGITQVAVAKTKPPGGPIKPHKIGNLGKTKRLLAQAKSPFNFWLAIELAN